MRFRAAAWFTFIWLTVPLSAIATQVFLASEFRTGTGYGLADNVLAYASLVLVAPIASLGAALLGGRLRRSGILELGPHARSPFAVYSRLVALPVLSMVLVMVLAMGFNARSGGSFSVDTRLIGLVALQALAYVLLGMALGMNLPYVVSVPAAIVIPYLVIGFPPAMEIEWLRHLTGVTSSCCFVYQDLPVQSVAAQALCSIFIALLATSALPMWSQRRVVIRWILAGLGVFALGGAVLVAQPLTARGVAVRAGSPVCQPAAQFQLCLWPEHESLRQSADQILQRIADNSQEVDAPTVFAEIVPEDARWPVTAIDLGTGTFIEWRFISALYPNIYCTNPSNSDQAGSANFQDEGPVVQAWWSAQLDNDPQDALNSAGANDQQRAEFARIAILPLPEQKLAINALVADAAAVCGGATR